MSGSASNTDDVVVAVHQPNFFPWLGYFAKMKTADVFFFFDDVEFSKGSYTNRSQIKVGDGAKWLTLPVQYKSSADIKDIKLAQKDWRQDHLRVLEGAYRKAPAFSATMALIERLYDGAPIETLGAFNIAILTQLAERLDIETRLERSSAIPTAGRADERLCQLVTAAGGSVYLSGSGGKKYQSDETYAAANIELRYSTFKPLPYEQHGGEFLPGLSILDVLFNVGIHGARRFIG